MLLSEPIPFFIFFFPAERRVALKAELDRLKGEGPAGQRKAPAGSSKAPENISVSASKGSISLHELRLPLKADFICSTANKPGRLYLYKTAHRPFCVKLNGNNSTVCKICMFVTWMDS